MEHGCTDIIMPCALRGTCSQDPKMSARNGHCRSQLEVGGMTYDARASEAVVLVIPPLSRDWVLGRGAGSVENELLLIWLRSAGGTQATPHAKGATNGPKTCLQLRLEIGT